MAATTPLQLTLNKFEHGHLLQLSPEMRTSFEAKLNQSVKLAVGSTATPLTPEHGFDEASWLSLFLVAYQLLRDVTCPINDRLSYMYCCTYSVLQTLRFESHSSVLTYLDELNTDTGILQPSTKAMAVTIKAYRWCMVDTNALLRNPKDGYRQAQIFMRQFKKDGATLAANVIRSEIWSLASLCAHKLGHDDAAATCLRKSYDWLAKPLARGFGMFSTRDYPASMALLLDTHENYLTDLMLKVVASLREEKHSRDVTDNYLLSLTHLVATYHYAHGQARRMLYNEIGATVRSAFAEAVSLASPEVVHLAFTYVNNIASPTHTIKRNGRHGCSMPPEVYLAAILNLIDYVHAGKQLLQVALQTFDWLCFAIFNGHISEECDMAVVNERLAQHGYNTNWHSLVDKFFSLDKNYIRINNDYELMRRLLISEVV